MEEQLIQGLVTKGRTTFIKGFKKKDGSGTYDARLAISDEFKVKLECGQEKASGAPGTKLARTYEDCAGVPDILE